MENRIPRILIAGTGSGCGKTTVSCAVLQAFLDRGLRAGAFKCGPDYIDPMFHSSVIGAPSSNLDPYFFDGNTMRYLLSRNGAGRDVNVIEGVMGYYDGLDFRKGEASTYEVARKTGTPVILTADARGASLSVLAVIAGFLDFLPDSGIKGVILNKCAAPTYEKLAEAIRERFGGRVEPLGFLPPVPESSLESRHLGLVTAAEVADLKEKMHRLAERAEQCVDLDGILRLARSAPAVSCEVPRIPRYGEKVRIAVARDRAFCFYYEDSLQMLRDMGAELTEFSPLEDKALPEGIDGLYLGGGYPELYAQALSANGSMLASVRQALERGLPCIAECGGFMYLTERIGGHETVGFLKGGCSDTGRLVRFGYVTLEAKTDNMLCKTGDRIRGHEFHHWDCENNGASFRAVKGSGRSWDCVHAAERLYAGFPHFHFYANPAFAAAFYETCLEEKRKRDREHPACGH